MINKDNFRIIDPYVPGDQPKFDDMVKLNTNENPYPPSPMVLKAAKKFDCESLKLYPPVDGGELKQAIAEYHEVSADKVFVGVGSDDVLAVIFQSLFASGREIMFPNISYSFYEVWADMYRIPFKKVPLKDDFTINVQDYTGKDANKSGGIIICNPNAPTAVALKASSIEEIVAANPTVPVIVDEAYVDFGGESVLPLIDKYDNLVVVRTFSKSRSMAGLRIGYAIADAAVIKVMNDVKNSVNSYTMNRTAIEIGAASLKDEKYFREQIEKIVISRAKLTTALSELGFSTLISSANFVFTTHKSIPAGEIFEKLKEKHIFVRHFNKPLIDNYLRITVGTDEQNSILINEIKNITQNAM